MIRHRLFRESCTQYQGNYVKNLSLLGRDLKTCIIVDNRSEPIRSVVLHTAHRSPPPQRQAVPPPPHYSSSPRPDPLRAASPLSYLFHPENAVGCISWIDQQDDDELRVIQVSTHTRTGCGALTFKKKLPPIGVGGG